MGPDHTRRLPLNVAVNTLTAAATICCCRHHLLLPLLLPLPFAAAAAAAATICCCRHHCRYHLLLPPLALPFAAAATTALHPRKNRHMKMKSCSAGLSATSQPPLLDVFNSLV